MRLYSIWKVNKDILLVYNEIIFHLEGKLRHLIGLYDSYCWELWSGL